MIDVAQRRQRGGPRPPMGPRVWALAVAAAAVALAGGLIVLERDNTRVQVSPETQTTGAADPAEPPPQPEPEPEPTVIFEDQFDGLNPDAWLVADYAVDVNNEKAYYTPDNVVTRDGMLVITAEEREVGGRDYASGLLSTAGKFDFTYGRVEWRAKMASGKGVWPSLWLNGSNCAETFMNKSQQCPTWPEPGSDELDVVEIAGSEPHLVHMTQHYIPAGEDYEGNPPNECDWEGPDMSADFHNYALEWTPDALVWYVDGVERCRATEPIPDTPKFLIMNMAIGGHFDGDPDDSTQFPVEYQIDWVRVTEVN